VFKLPFFQTTLSVRGFTDPSYVKGDMKRRMGCSDDIFSRMAVTKRLAPAARRPENREILRDLANK
jgi:hypothetical protein